MTTTCTDDQWPFVWRLPMYSQLYHRATEVAQKCLSKVVVWCKTSERIASALKKEDVAYGTSMMWHQSDTRVSLPTKNVKVVTIRALAPLHGYVGFFRPSLPEAFWLLLNYVDASKLHLYKTIYVSTYAICKTTHEPSNVSSETLVYPHVSGEPLRFVETQFHLAW